MSSLLKWSGYLGGRNSNDSVCSSEVVSSRQSIGNSTVESRRRRACESGPYKLCLSLCVDVKYMLNIVDVCECWPCTNSLITTCFVQCYYDLWCRRSCEQSFPVLLRLYPIFRLQWIFMEDDWLSDLGSTVTRARQWFHLDIVINDISRQ